MKHLADFAALALLLLACGCSGKERAIEPSYVGKVEVLRDLATTPTSGSSWKRLPRKRSLPRPLAKFALDVDQAALTLALSQRERGPSNGLP